MPSSKGPLLPGFPFKILGFYFPPPVPLPVCPSAGLRASSDWSSRVFLMRSTRRFAADSDSCRGASTELTPRRLGGSLVLLTECRESSAWIWQSAADRCLFEVPVWFRNIPPAMDRSPIGQANRTLRARVTASETLCSSLKSLPSTDFRPIQCLHHGACVVVIGL